MKTILAFAALGAVSMFSLAATVNEAEAAVCARGVARAGCAGPNGAVVVRRAPPPAAGCRWVNGRRVCGVVR